MAWTKLHDTMLLREVLVVNPFQAEKKTSQRADYWQQVINNLKGLEDPPFKDTMNGRSVQDRYALLCKKRRTRLSFERRASGISSEVTELDLLIEEAIEKEKISEETRVKEGEEQAKKLKEDKENAIDVRKKAMETLGETRRRKIGDEKMKENKVKQRRSGNETMEFLREQSDRDQKMKEKEMELERERLDAEETKHNGFKEMMAQQMAIQQQNMNQFRMMMLCRCIALIFIVPHVISVVTYVRVE